MPSKLERELDEIVKKVGSLRTRPSSGAIIRNTRWTFYSFITFFKRLLPFALQPSAIMPVGFMVLVAGLLVRSFNSTLGTALLLSGIAFIVVAHLTYITRPARKPTGWRGRDLNRR
ncbi:MAG: hypothetical protein EXR59_00885 [Dehalococcoidia bacterium]|nr:hypothetical protein [Dehalococcoidia bacterium]